MSVKDKIDNLFYKVNDLINDGKSVYEKNCCNITCFSLNDIRKSTTIKGIIDFDNLEVRFSGSLEVGCKDVPKPWFFVAPSAEIFIIDEKTVETISQVVELKTKSDNHIITKSNIKLQNITLN